MVDLYALITLSIAARIKCFVSEFLSPTSVWVNKAQVLQLVALHVLYVALGFHASHLQALWTSNGHSTMRSGQPGATETGRGSHVRAGGAACCAAGSGWTEPVSPQARRTPGWVLVLAWEADDEGNPSHRYGMPFNTNVKNTWKILLCVCWILEICI